MRCVAPQLYQIGNVVREFVDLCVVVPLNILEEVPIIRCDEGDRHSLATKTARTINTAHVILRPFRKVEVDNQRHLQGHAQSLAQEI
jgi:hypothetical protein